MWHHAHAGRSDAHLSGCGQFDTYAQFHAQPDAQPHPHTNCLLDAVALGPGRQDLEHNCQGRNGYPIVQAKSDGNRHCNCNRNAIYEPYAFPFRYGGGN